MTTFKAQGVATQIQVANRSDNAASKSVSLQEARQLRDAPPPFPFGWYAVAFSGELRGGGILTRRFMDREIVIYRTKSGLACAIEAYCPHLGTHLGHGGEVHGEELRCPFHGFRFSVDGSCVYSPVGAPPPAARLGRLELREIHGVILVWHGPPGQTPWEIEPLGDESGWHRIRHITRRLRSHPQEITENSIDIMHLSVLHGFENVRMIQPLTLDGPRLRTAYRFIQPAPLSPGFEAEIRIRIDGLGFSVIEMKMVGWSVRLLGLATPVGERDTIAHLGVAVRKRGRSVAGKALWSSLERVVGPTVLRGMVDQFKQDELIWNHKKYLRRPAIAAGDGQIHAYRQWASQFYPEGAQC